MKKDWQIKKLGEVCEKLYAGGDKPKNFSKEKTDEYQIPIYANGVTDNGLYGYTDKPIETQKSLTISARGTIGFSCIRTEPFVPIVRLIVLVPSEYINIDFLNYCCQTLVITNTGSSIPQLTIPMIRDYLIPIPPLEEQKRIVAVLDKKFAQIETLKTAAEKNLQNTKQLFQAELEKAFSNTSWETQLFSDLFKLTSGEYLNSKSIIKGQYPIYGGNGIIAYHNEYNLTGDNIIIGRVGALCGNVRFLSEPIWLTDNAFKLSFLKDPFDYKFLTYLLNFKDLRKYARQAAQPVISNSSLKDIEIPLPPLEEQKRIVAHLDSLCQKVHQLEEIYTKQLADCDELKQAFLHKAFEGEL